MKKLNFSTNINASKEIVWQSLWDGANYPTWTSVFSEGSHVITDGWKEGTKVLFLDGKGCGMVSTVAANKVNQYMSFTHLGMVDDGKEDTSSEKVKEFAGATETYTLNEAGGVTSLTVEVDITDEHAEYFTKTFPVALEKVKSLSENNN
ncbi:MAG TPA: SRPBCC domain-containing protein [Flavisolibacter sp.]|nr:SRPBCC domain-containing protein [Flavisolibacter sp.]